MRKQFGYGAQEKSLSRNVTVKLKEVTELALQEMKRRVC